MTLIRVHVTIKSVGKSLRDFYLKVMGRLRKFMVTEYESFKIQSEACVIGELMMEHSDKEVADMASYSITCEQKPTIEKMQPLKPISMIHRK